MDAFVSVLVVQFVRRFTIILLCVLAAYKHADGKKIDGRRVLVDIERGRTIKGWRARRLGKSSLYSDAIYNTNNNPSPCGSTRRK